MKISSKVRNGLAAMIYIAKNSKNNTKISLLSISTSLDISKIYLEQAFVLLKKENLVISTKGPKGGYALSREASKITVYDILVALDGSIFEKTENTVSSNSKEIENVMQSYIFSEIDNSLKNTLENITLEQIVDKLSSLESDDFMYYL